MPPKILDVDVRPIYCRFSSLQKESNLLTPLQAIFLSKASRVPEKEPLFLSLSHGRRSRTVSEKP